MIADRCTETSRATATDLCTNMALELRASCCRLSWGTKPGSTTLNLNQEAIDWMAPYDIPKEEIQRVPYAGKTSQSFGMRRYSCELIAQRINSNLQLPYWNTRKSE